MEMTFLKIVQTEILSTFHARVKYKSALKMSFKPKGRTPPPKKTTHFLWDTWTPCIYYTHPPPTPLTNPNGILIHWRTCAQLRNKFPIGYNGMPHIHPKSVLPFNDLYRHVKYPSSTDPITTPNTIQIQSTNTQTKTSNLGCESAVRLPLSTSTIAIYYCYSVQKLILILPSHGG